LLRFFLTWSPWKVARVLPAGAGVHALLEIPRNFSAEGSIGAEITLELSEWNNWLLR
jgi:hypothetical protein